MWKYFVLGMLVGWLLHWLLDRLSDRYLPSRPAPVVDGRGTTDARKFADGRADSPGVIEPNAAATTTADTTAGRIAGDVAIGAPGAVSTSSATLTTRAPVYRQEDLEAIPGIGPKVGAMLRNNGITTFALLAATPWDELTRIVESAGETVGGPVVATWPGQARLAADQDWAGLATFSAARPMVPPDRQ